jgi:hypothetical protein
MWLLSDTVAFPVLQLLLLVGLVVALIKDTPRIQNKGDRVEAHVLRSDESMSRLGNTAGFAVVVISLINATAFNNDSFWLKDYTVAFNIVDLLIVLYLCFWCGWTRNWILGTFEAARME